MDSDDITVKSFTKFVIPSIIMLVFVSFYTSVDSLFIAHYVGSDGLAAQNLVMPLSGVAFSCGIMFASGGGAIIAIKLGKGKITQANKDFSSLITVGLALGIISTVICYLYLENILVLLGVTQGLQSYAQSYGTFLILAFPLIILNVIFENVLRIDNRPHMSLLVTITGGVVNILFDYLFVCLWKWGIKGAGIATFTGLLAGTVIALISFWTSKAKFNVCLGRPDFLMIKAAVVNGFSEMITEIATAVATFIMNILALKYIGTDGVAALTIVLTFNFFASSLFIGFSMGTAPLLSYYYGQKNYQVIRKIINYSKKYIISASILILVIFYFFTDTFVSFFVPESNSVFKTAEQGLTFLSVALFICGTNIYGSAFFTAFENGKISAVISFCRTFIFFILSALIFPYIFKAEGIWMILPVAELCSLFLVMYFFFKYQKKYNYKVV